jgi:hypothetical protein
LVLIAQLEHQHRMVSNISITAAGAWPKNRDELLVFYATTAMDQLL